MDRYREAVDENAELVLCFSCPSRHYFRHDVLAGYKANRSAATPIGLRKLKDWINTQYDTKTKPNLEADDVVGILATSPKLIKGRKIIVSMDKDLQQIPGEHLNGSRPEEGTFRITSEFAERFRWMQVLTGDSTDNYAGLPGCGPVGATKVIASARPDEPLSDVVLAAYLKAGLTKSDFAQQTNVATILTATMYDFKRKEPILWPAT